MAGVSVFLALSHTSSLVCASRSREQLNEAEQIRQARFQSSRDAFDIHEGDVPYPGLDPAVIRPVQAAALCRFLLIDSLLLA